MKRIFLAVAIVLLLVPPASAQWRHGGGEFRGGGFARPGYGGGLGGAIIGGAIIGGMLMRPPPVYVAPPVYVQPAPVYVQPQVVVQPPFDPVAYCASRFRSYNPATGLYLSYSGDYRPCP